MSVAHGIFLHFGELNFLFTKSSLGCEGLHLVAHFDSLPGQIEHYIFIQELIQFVCVFCTYKSVFSHSSTNMMAA